MLDYLRIFTELEPHRWPQNGSINLGIVCRQPEIQAEAYNHVLQNDVQWQWVCIPRFASISTIWDSAMVWLYSPALNATEVATISRNTATMNCIFDSEWWFVIFRSWCNADDRIRPRFAPGISRSRVDALLLLSIDSHDLLTKREPFQGQRLCQMFTHISHL